MQPAALDLIKALSAVLDRWGRWYLFGAQAVVAYGVPRFSADVDVTVKLDPDDPERFVSDMEAGGFHAPCRRSGIRAANARDSVRSRRHGHAA